MADRGFSGEQRMSRGGRERIESRSMIMDDYSFDERMEPGGSGKLEESEEHGRFGDLGPPFSALIGQSNDAPVVEVRGEVDIATVPRLLEAIGLAGARLNGRPLIVMDLRDIAFIDVYGVRVLVEEALAMEGLGGELRLVVPRIGSVSRLFGLLGVGRMLKLHHALDTELSADGGPGEESDDHSDEQAS